MWKITAVFLTLFLITCTLAGCSKIDHNAVLITEGAIYSESWFDNHLTKGSAQSDYDDALPESRTFIIRNQAELNEIFTDFPVVDFSQEMVLVYCYTTCYNGRAQVLEKAVVKNGVLNVEFNVERGKFGHADASAPLARLCIIRLDNVDFTDVRITYKGQ